MNRIDAIYSFIDKEDRVVDVGCDQAKLAILLSKRGQSSIASDISENVIDRARRDINNPLIDLRVSDGLENIKQDEVDTLVLSGMGTHTIIDIMSKTDITFKKIITISNNYHDVLRTKMNDLGYKVETELIVKENHKYYNLIVFIKGKTKYNESDLLLGLNHKDINMYKEYLEYLLNKYILISKKSNNKNKKIVKLIDLLNKKMKLLN